MSAHFLNFNRKPSGKRSTLPKEGNPEIIEAAQREILRQARRSFNLHEIGVAASLVFGLVTGALALTDHIPAAGATAATGFGFITYSAQMNKDAQEKLGDLLDGLEKISNQEKQR